MIKYLKSILSNLSSKEVENVVIDILNFKRI